MYFSNALPSCSLKYFAANQVVSGYPPVSEAYMILFVGAMASISKMAWQAPVDAV